MEISSKNNRSYLTLRNQYGDVLPVQLLIVATSGSGKGLAEESFIEKWRESTKGIVIIISDPKNEAEFSYVMYKPEKRYHLERLKLDGKLPKSYSCKLYHPFTFNIPKGYLPQINFFTIPIKSMTREDWGILTESPYDSESIKLMMRVSQTITKNDGRIKLLHEIERLVQGKKDRKKPMPDPKNHYLRVGGGTSKSVTEISNLLNPFDKNYFLRKESCPYKLDWEKILTDNENYHVFLSMWLKDDKLKDFMVLNLLQQIINNRQYLKRPLMIVIPELLKQCNRDEAYIGYKSFLANSIASALVTVRSIGRGISIISDTQNWLQLADKVKGAFGSNIFGQLNPKDQEAVCKAMNYKREIREKLQNMDKNSFYIYGEESSDPFRFFFPSHMHKEPEYNWLEMYHKYFSEKEVRYEDLIKYMKEEFEEEEKWAKDVSDKVLEQERQEEIKKIQNKKSKNEEKQKPKQEKEDKNKRVIMKQIYDIKNDPSVSNREKTWRKIGNRFELNHITAKKYYERYEKYLSEQNSPESIKEMIGDGVMPEEIEDNFKKQDINN